MQCIRELVMIEEEKEKADNEEEDDEDEDGMLDDDDDDEDDEDIKAVSRKTKASGSVALLVATSRSADGSSVLYTRLAVPEGGYDEEEDCLNAEDEEYRQVGLGHDDDPTERESFFLLVSLNHTCTLNLTLTFMTGTRGHGEEGEGQEHAIRGRRGRGCRGRRGDATHTHIHPHTYTHIHTLPVMSIPSIHLPYRY